MMIDLRYEDEEVIVVYKPAGIAVQTRSVGEEDLESLLKKYLRTRGTGKTDLKIVHRLDQPVEGFLVFARTAEAAKDLSEQVQSKESCGEKTTAASYGSMSKEYTAVVYGRMPEEKGTLTDYLIKNARTNTSSVTTDHKNGKRSVLDYEVMKTEEKTQMLRVYLKTGRHHQIRVQLAHAGCPILGDSKYKNDEAETYAKANDIKQLQLFADRLTFIHPKTKKKMEFSEERE